MAETAAGGGSDDDSDQLVSIHEAAENCNVVQLQRALAAGVSPNITRTGQSAIHILCLADGSDPGFDHEARMACLDLLRQSPDFDVNLRDGAGDRAIHYVACHATSRDDVEFMQAVVDAGADVNATGSSIFSRKAIHWVMCDSGPFSVRAAKIDLLIRAGASVTARDNDGETPLDLAISKVEISSPSTELISERQRMRRVYPLLLAAGATLPTEASDPYLQRVIAAGSFANYERQHFDKLTRMLTPRRGPSSPLRRVPPEVLRNIAAFAFHVGYY